LVLCCGTLACIAHAQPVPASTPNAPPLVAEPSAVDERFENRIIREIRIDGLSKVDEQLIRNQIRSKVGQPLSGDTVRSDVRQLTRLGRFNRVDAKFQVLADQSIVLTFELGETPVIEDVQAVGNRQLNDNEIAAEISLLKGVPIDEYQLASAARRIQELYRKRGFYQAQVVVDEAELKERGIVLFKISEGVRTKITDIRFEGNAAFAESQLRGEIKTEEQGLFETGAIDDLLLDQDVAAIITFYKDRGRLDVRCDRRVTFAPNAAEAVVTFVIDEGPLYTLRSVKAIRRGDDQPAATAPRDADKPAERRADEAPTVFTSEQLAALMPIKPGDVYSVDKITRAIDSVRNAYLRLGYVDATVERFELRDENSPQVDILLVVTEGRRFRTGLVEISGNSLTQQKVIRRHVAYQPDRPLDASTERRGDQLVPETERKLRELRLFDPQSIKVTVQPEDPDTPGYRDVLVEVKETNTAALSFGAGISSDGGVTGLINLNQRNFDLLDTPDSLGEFFSGRAFRGGGQVFDICVAPGTEVQTYSISLSDPYLFETDYSGSASAYFRQREFDQFDEDRLGARASVGRRFGERWSGNVATRVESINIRDIESDSPVDVFDVKGDNFITGLGFNLTRTTIDSRFRPTTGTRTELGVERVGLFGGDYDFTKLSGEHQVFIPIAEDFFNRRSVLSFKLASSYIPEGEDETPLFERYYLGGRSFRGFGYRTISPKGIRNDTGLLGDDPVGGTWSFFAGAEYEQPLFTDFIAVVFFVDSGTVTNDVGFDDYRVSAGLGLRLYVEALSPAPFAFDFGFPLIKQFGDEERVFSFSIDLPF
jgi:outer membrane protein insertion porin family